MTYHWIKIQVYYKDDDVTKFNNLNGQDLSNKGTECSLSSNISVGKDHLHNNE